ncbi:hypothetical protein K432DRAFT_446010 [Lepidopterella palustris CBS 459.81]|uniref:Uncharacterized protein n=1 Tax=Lepidopterella palustris CBS 459.81 TaxID=1314670 RepID=A0A8E2E3E2_9PEZI|nr:hypothetical protein K432DRAFT_446010 [Lepidopterella palustris CBS 459.81]
MYTKGRKQQGKHEFIQHLQTFSARLDQAQAKLALQNRPDLSYHSGSSFNENWPNEAPAMFENSPDPSNSSISTLPVSYIPDPSASFNHLLRFQTPSLSIELAPAAAAYSVPSLKILSSITSDPIKPLVLPRSDIKIHNNTLPTRVTDEL